MILTGGAFTEQARAFLDRIPNPSLEKPFEVDALRALVSEQLGRRARAGRDDHAG